MYSSVQVAGVKSTRTAGGAGKATGGTWSWRMAKMRMKTRRNESIMILTESLCVCVYTSMREAFLLTCVE